jgi:very-short-patch-repair endonuclease
MPPVPATRPRLAFRRSQRAEPSRIERILWTALRDRRFHDLKFRRQHSVGPYVADFFCEEAGIVVEADGPVHGDRVVHDARRDAWMRAQGLIVVRLPEAEVLTALELALARVERALVARGLR